MAKHNQFPPSLAFLLLLFSGWVNRRQQAVIDYLLEENRVLRAAQGNRRPRLTDDQRRRLAVKGHVLGRRHLAAVAGLVTPDTILRWCRTLVAQKYDGSTRRRPGRPASKPDIAALVVRMANENPTWGYTRIRGGLTHLGHDVARNTIKAILKDHGACSCSITATPPNIDRVFAHDEVTNLAARVHGVQKVHNEIKGSRCGFITQDHHPPRATSRCSWSASSRSIFESAET